MQRLLHRSSSCVSRPADTAAAYRPCDDARTAAQSSRRSTPSCQRRNSRQRITCSAHVRHVYLHQHGRQQQSRHVQLLRPCSRLRAAAHGCFGRPQLQSSLLPAWHRLAPVCAVMASSALPMPQTTDETLILLERLQRNALETGTGDGMNLVVLGGGVASSLAAFLVHAVFEDRCAAVFVRLPGSSDTDVARARYLASFVGIELWELPGEGPVTEGTDMDAGSHPRLSGALAAVRYLLEARGSPPAVVFDGLHAEDLPPTIRSEAEGAEAAGWDGSEDSGEALAGLNYATASEAADRDVDVEVAAPLAGLPAARRVSLLAGLPEVAVRAVADVAGMPNWDWLPEEQPEPTLDGARASEEADRLVDRAAAVNEEEAGFAQAEAESLVVQLLRLGPDDRLRIHIGEAAEAVVELEEGKVPAAQSIEAQLASRLAELGLQPLTIRAASP